jgi:hypothetical protein
MAENREWAHRAQAEALRAEIDLLRGVVAALRTRPPPARTPGSASRGWALVLFAFAFGGLAVLVLLAVYPQAICP